jgi:ATP-dependent Clp protease ATP-binding subunit ClpB
MIPSAFFSGAVSPAALSMLAERSYDPEYGARPAGRVLQQLVLSPLASALLTQDILPGQSVLMDIDEDELTFGVTQSTDAADAPEVVTQ